MSNLVPPEVKSTIRAGLTWPHPFPYHLELCGRNRPSPCRGRDEKTLRAPRARCCFYFLRPEKRLLVALYCPFVRQSGRLEAVHSNLWVAVKLFPGSASVLICLDHRAPSGRGAAGYIGGAPSIGSDVTLPISIQDASFASQCFFASRCAPSLLLANETQQLPQIQIEGKTRRSTLFDMNAPEGMQVYFES